MSKSEPNHSRDAHGNATWLSIRDPQWGPGLAEGDDAGILWHLIWAAGLPALALYFLTAVAAAAGIAFALR
jgi:hypothetical protein